MHRPCELTLLSNTVYLPGLYVVGDKGEKGLPGPPGRCDCDSLGANNAPFGSYTQRRGSDKVTAVRPLHTLYTMLQYPVNMLSLN